MAAVSYIRTSKDQKLLLLGIIEEGESRRYTVSGEVYASVGSPAARTELSEREMSVIKYADELYRAEKKALSILSFADSSARTLKMKLQRAGFGREIAEEITEKMLALGYINESRQLERLVLTEANDRLRGPLKLIPHLVSKGYPAADVRRAVSTLVDEGEVDFAENAKRLLKKKLPDGATAEERKKLLYRNGYKV